MKKIITLVLVLTLALALTACGGGDGGDADQADGAGDAKPTVLRVGTSPDFEPFEYPDEKTGEPIGFDIDLINAIAADQGMSTEIVVLGFDALIPAVQSGNIDTVASGVTIDPDKLKGADFSDPYINSGLALLTKEADAVINGEADLQGKKVGVQIGTTGYKKANELKEAGIVSEVVVLNTVDMVMLELLNGGVDAVINDLPVANAYIAKQPGKVKIVGEPLTSEDYGFPVAKGNKELLDKLNAGLKNVKADGTYDELIKKYF